MRRVSREWAEDAWGPMPNPAPKQCRCPPGGDRQCDACWPTDEDVPFSDERGQPDACGCGHDADEHDPESGRCFGEIDNGGDGSRNEPCFCPYYNEEVGT